MRPLRRAILTRGILAGALAGLTQPLGAAEHWDPIEPALLAQSASTLDADAPAEAVFRRITVNDRGYPAVRKVDEYSRYKIFDPEKATAVTRFAVVEASINGERIAVGFDIHARLTLPNGTTKDFGRESIQQRSLAKIGTERSWFQKLLGGEEAELNEKFLAISGIEPGAVIDIHLAHRGDSPTGRSLGNVQESFQLAIPTRRLEFAHLLADKDDYSDRPFLLNSQSNHAEFRPDAKTMTVAVFARDVPAVEPEPFTGPPADYALTYLCAYKPRHLYILTHHSDGRPGTIGNGVAIARTAGPWTGYATEVAMFERDMAQPSYRLRQLTTEITAGAPTEEEKARRIHRFVQDLHWNFLRMPRQRHPLTDPMKSVDSIEALLDCEKHPDWQIPPNYFDWLALTLFRLAGLEARTVMLPNRDFVEYDPRLVADMFLPVQAVQVRAGGQWQFSCQTQPVRLALGQVPWTASGRGLIAQINQQEFVDAPLTPAEQSTVTNTGKFLLGADGSLRGTCARAFTGQLALAVRMQLRLADLPRQKNFFRRMLAAELRAARVRVLSVTGFDDPDQPLVVSYQMINPDFATLTKERMIFRPSLYHSSPSVFSAAVRRHPIRFPFPRQEIDQIEIHFPADYAVETKWAPPSLPGDDLSYRCDMSYLPRQHIFRLGRQYTCQVVAIPISSYSDFKAWTDQMEASDQHELVLLRTPGAAPAAPAPPPAEAPESAEGREPSL